MFHRLYGPAGWKDLKTINRSGCAIKYGEKRNLTLQQDLNLCPDELLRIPLRSIE